MSALYFLEVVNIYEERRTKLFLKSPELTNQIVYWLKVLWREQARISHCIIDQAKADMNMFDHLK